MNIEFRVVKLLSISVEIVFELIALHLPSCEADYKIINYLQIAVYQCYVNRHS